jgi:hypothetical protein
MMMPFSYWLGRNTSESEEEEEVSEERVGAGGGSSQLYISKRVAMLRLIPGGLLWLLLLLLLPPLFVGRVCLVVARGVKEGEDWESTEESVASLEEVLSLAWEENDWRAVVVVAPGGECRSGL